MTSSGVEYPVGVNCAVQCYADETVCFGVSLAGACIVP